MTSFLKNCLSFFCNMSLSMGEKDNYLTEILGFSSKKPYNLSFLNECISLSHSMKYYKNKSNFVKKLSMGDNYAISMFCLESNELQDIPNSANFAGVGF